MKRDKFQVNYLFVPRKNCEGREWNICRGESWVMMVSFELVSSEVLIRASGARPQQLDGKTSKSTAAVGG